MRPLTDVKRHPLVPPMRAAVTGCLDGVERYAGPSRFETAAVISAATFATADHVVLAMGLSYADALVGAPLTLGEGPLLLTGAQQLHPASAEEIRRLRPSRVTVMGDHTAMSDSVVAEVEALGVKTVARVAGSDRFATAAAAARALVGADRVYLVEGAHADPRRGWPDAVAVAALATAQGRPVLLSERDRLPADSADVIADLDVPVTIVGGEPAVSATVEQAVRDLGVPVDRISGGTRYETSVAVGARAAEEGLDPQTPWLVTGENWPDALAAGPAAAARGELALLAPPAGFGHDDPVAAWLASHQPTSAALAGGRDVLSHRLAAQLARIIGS